MLVKQFTEKLVCFYYLLSLLLVTLLLGCCLFPKRIIFFPDCYSPGTSACWNGSKRTLFPSYTVYLKCRQLCSVLWCSSPLHPDHLGLTVLDFPFSPGWPNLGLFKDFYAPILLDDRMNGWVSFPWVWSYRESMYHWKFCKLKKLFLVFKHYIKNVIVYLFWFNLIFFFHTI